MSTVVKTDEMIAKIRGTTLGYEDHGIFTAYLELDYGSSAQGAGGMMFDYFDKDLDKRIGRGEGIQWIAGVLGACGVRTWEEVKGRTVIAITESGRVVGLKPLPTEKGKRFMFVDAFPPREDES